MRRKHEAIEGRRVSCWDSGGDGDRWTLVDLDSENGGRVQYYGMNGCPFSPNMGVAQSGEMPLSAVQYRGRGGAFLRRVAFSDFPPDTQKAGRAWLRN